MTTGKTTRVADKEVSYASASNGIRHEGIEWNPAESSQKEIRSPSSTEVTSESLDANLFVVSTCFSAFRPLFKRLAIATANHTPVNLNTFFLANAVCTLS